jgi:prophage maintenance system killer protein
MAKIPSGSLQEIFFGSSDKSKSAELNSLEKQGLINKIAPRIYSSKIGEDPAFVVKRNWFRVLSHQYPNAIISHRSALEFKPTPEGHIYLTYTYSNKVDLPGLTIHFLKGHGSIKGDTPLFEYLYVSQEARAYLENMEPSRKKGDESKSLPLEEIEEKLETIIRIKGEGALNKIRDSAREISKLLQMENEYNKLNHLISAMLSSGAPKNLKSQVARARVSGEPFDKDRIELFENLYEDLAGKIFPDYLDKNDTQKFYKNFAFFESYFSNYIEGTEFEVSEAKKIILTETPMASRNEDSHDILGTYQIVSDKYEMSRIPTSADALLELLRERHAILLGSRISKKPGEFKTTNNRAGNTEFVDWQLVTGTLKKGYEWYSLLQHPFAKATFVMFLVSEVHPFLDGNGRMARIMMNAELSSKGFSKIIIPNVYREDYLVSLKKLTRQRITEPYIRMLLRAYEFSSNIFDENLDAMENYLLKCDAFQEPKEGKLRIIARLPPSP